MGRKRKNARRGGRIGGRFSIVRAEAREEEAWLSIAPSAGGGRLERIWSDLGRLPGDARDIHAVDAEVIQIALGEAHQLVIRVPILPPVAVALDKLVRHLRSPFSPNSAAMCLFIRIARTGR